MGAEVVENEQRGVLQRGEQFVVGLLDIGPIGAAQDIEQVRYDGEPDFLAAIEGEIGDRGGEVRFARAGAADQGQGATRGRRPSRPRRS